jgi:hypothetical protein
MSHLKKLSILIALLFVATKSYSQHINWGGLTSDNKHIVNLNVNWDYASTLGVYYGYKLNVKIPIIAGIEYAMPVGKTVLDDFKSKIGIQMQWINYRNFRLSTKVQGIFRRYEQPIVRLMNFGSDLSGAIGYYKPKWFVAAEFGFDKAIVTHFKHSTRYRQSFESVRDGWYEPATGGNVYYGLLGGITFKKHELYVKIGKVVTQDFKTTPMIPYYGQLGYNFKFGKRNHPK